MYSRIHANLFPSQDQWEIDQIIDISCISPICTDNSPYIDLAWYLIIRPFKYVMDRNGEKCMDQSSFGWPFSQLGFTWWCNYSNKQPKGQHVIGVVRTDCTQLLNFNNHVICKLDQTLRQWLSPDTTNAWRCWGSVTVSHDPYLARTGWHLQQ